MKPNFKDINIKASEKASMSAAEWEKANHIAKNWTTPELIPVKPVYTADDLKQLLSEAGFSSIKTVHKKEELHIIAHK